MRLDKNQHTYIRQMTSIRSSPKEVFEFILELIEREQDKASLVQSLRLQDLWTLLKDQIETLEDKN